MLFLVPAALAYETDQLTSRLDRLADAAPLADPELDRLREQAANIE
jgi:hypothetical protein